MRICPDCGRPKTKDHHDVRTRRVLNAETLEYDDKPFPPGTPDRWVCRVEQISTYPEGHENEGKTLRTNLPQRFKVLDTRFVLSSRLTDEGELIA